MKQDAKKLKPAINKLAKKHQLKLVLLFGSFASGKNRGDSDLDIAVLSSKKISFIDEIDMANEFSSLFGKNADLTILNRANPLLLFQVSKNAVLLCGSRKDFLNFKLYAFKAYHDYTPYFEMERKLNKKIIDTYAD